MTILHFLWQYENSGFRKKRSVHSVVAVECQKCSYTRFMIVVKRAIMTFSQFSGTALKRVKNESMTGIRNHSLAHVYDRFEKCQRLLFCDFLQLPKMSKMTVYDFDDSC